MINKLILVGRLTADPEVRATGGGVAVANLRVVTNSYGGKDDAGKRREHTEFHRLVLFGRSAEVAAEFLRKGRLIYAEGRIQTSTWDDPAGNKQRSTEVVVETFQILTGGGRTEAEAA